MVIKEGTSEAKSLSREERVLCSFGSKTASSTQWWTAGEKVLAFQEHCSLNAALVLSFSVLAFVSLCCCLCILLQCVFCLQSRFGLWLAGEWSLRLCITWSDSSWCSGVPAVSSEFPSSSWEPGWRWWPHQTPSSGPSGSMLNIPHSNMHQSDEKQGTNHQLEKKNPTTMQWSTS